MVRSIAGSEAASRIIFWWTITLSVSPRSSGASSPSFGDLAGCAACRPSPATARSQCTLRAGVRDRGPPAGCGAAASSSSDADRRRCCTCCIRATMTRKYSSYTCSGRALAHTFVVVLAKTCCSNLFASSFARATASGPSPTTPSKNLCLHPHSNPRPRRLQLQHSRHPLLHAHFPVPPCTRPIPLHLSRLESPKPSQAKQTKPNQVKQSQAKPNQLAKLHHGLPNLRFAFL